MSNSRRLEAGRILATPVPGDEVVITGISGRFPNSDNVEEFKENLMNKVDLCDDDDRRWVHSHAEIPKVSGKVNGVEKFDLGFFGVHRTQADFTDPLVRMTTESAYEAMIDAGFNPDDLRGTNVGVFVGTSYSEAEKMICYDYLKPHGYGVAGCTRSMIAHRISYALQLEGPSMICDTACSSGLYAFNQAYKAIREGKCEMALVGGCNLCFNPYVTLQFARLGVLNMNTGCRPFDENASGYTRSEAIGMMLLQKKKTAKRIYAEVVHCKANVDGYKELGITYPSGDVQALLLKDVYEECGVSPSAMAFVEAHGTGTKVGDPEELNAIDKFFCADRNTPLLVGSIKGNIGHTEPASGICSVMKMIYAMETGLIPPNIHFDNPRKDIKGLECGRLKVVTEKTPWPKISNLAALSCFGFGGANCHVLFKRPEDPQPRSDDGQPRLVCYSGRTSESMDSYSHFFKSKKFNYDAIALFHSIFRKRISNDTHRGFSLVDSNGEIQSSYKYSPMHPKHLHLFLGGANLHHEEFLKELDTFKFFSNLINEFKEALKRNQISNDLSINSVLATVCLHYCLIQAFQVLKVPFSSISASSLGEFTAAYAVGVLSLDETILGVLRITKVFAESKRIENDLQKKLLLQLNEVLPKRSAQKTIVNVPKTNGFDYGSAEYFVCNILNAAAVKDFQWSDEDLLVAVDFPKSVKSVKAFQMVRDGMKLNDVLVSFGKLYELGMEGDWSELYEKTEWPVGRGTANISSLIKWKHDKDFLVPKTMNSNCKDPEKHALLSLLTSELMFYKGHVIDGRNLFPATGYLFLIWEFYASIKGVLFQHMKICFESIKFHRATTFGKDGIIDLYLVIQKDGWFEVSESNTTIVTGRIYEVERTDIQYAGKPNDPKDPKLNQKDIYKELKLRGYNYKGPFKAIHEICGNNGLIEWAGNWITYLDNMLQLFIVQNDTRSLYVPTGLDRLVIDARAHMDQGEDVANEKLIPVELAVNGRIARSKHIEIRGINVNAITRRKPNYEPVLELHRFVPNFIDLSLPQSIRVNTHIVLENKPTNTVKVLEILDDESSANQPISQHILNTLGDLPLIQADLIIYTKRSLDEIKGIQVSDSLPEQKSLMYVGTNLLMEPKRLQGALANILDDGYIMSIDKAPLKAPEGFAILTTHVLPTKEIVHLVKRLGRYQEPQYVNVVQDLDKWLPSLQEHMKSTDPIMLYSEGDETSGLLGLANCLRREPGGEKISCMFIQQGSSFDSKDPFFRKQMEKGLAANVLRGRTWGTYRHMLLDQNPKLDYRKCDHYFGNVLTRGDLSTWSFLQGPFTKQQVLNEKDLIEIYYSAINFRDVMTATGKVPVDAVTTNRMEQDRVQGFEYSGKRQNGERVMGIVIGGAIANMIKCDPFLTWTVPDEWTLEDAATVPVVYITVVIALTMRGNVKRGDSILIHSGTGGVGQAAISCAHYWGCELFVTVGSKEKKDFLLNNYPFLKESHIGNSRDTTFEQMISSETGGRGVDYVLNSLAEEKLAASVRCLKPGGCFLEIGKFDLANNNSLALDLVEKGCTFHGIMLDTMMKTSENRVLMKLYQQMEYGLDAGFVKPLIRTTFGKNQLEESFRYMASGKHMGKVVLKIKDEFAAPDKNEEKKIVIPRFYCSPYGSYIILGGLGGFGLELADWLVLRGAKTLILSSRSGVQTGYQKYRIQFWQSCGVKIEIALEDISTAEGCETILRNAEAIAPVHGIFNLAVVLKDAIFENQSVENFKISMSPKATATKHFDKLTRQSKTLTHFVVFSSVSCGRGNAGQTNYGMSNSMMERICELRRKNGLPGLAIQWGAVGDVGLVADMQKDQSEIAIGGTLQQRVSNCLDVLDNLLHQDEAVVSSMVVAEKSGLGSAENLVDAVVEIMGLRDLKTISLHTSLAELGMDSMMAIEIKQTLERDFDIFLSAQDMRNLSFAKLIELNESNSPVGEVTEENADKSFKMLLNKVYDHERFLLPLIPFKNPVEDEDCIIVFPGVEGAYLGMVAINDGLEKPSICVQYTTVYDVKEIDVLVDKIMNNISGYVTKSQSFKFVAHSYGSLIALEVASRLEKMGKTGKVALVDGSPELMNHLYKLLTGSSNSELETTIITTLLANYTPNDTLNELSRSLLNAKSFDERLEISKRTISDDATVPKEMLVNLGIMILNLVKSLARYKQFEGKLRSEVVLCKPSLPLIKAIAPDYKLNSLCVNPVKILHFDGDHRSILENSKLHDELNNIFTDE